MLNNLIIIWISKHWKIELNFARFICNHPSTFFSKLIWKLFTRKFRAPCSFWCWIESQAWVDVMTKSGWRSTENLSQRIRKLFSFLNPIKNARRRRRWRRRMRQSEISRNSQVDKFFSISYYYCALAVVFLFTHRLLHLHEIPILNGIAASCPLFLALWFRLTHSRDFSPTDDVTWRHKVEPPAFTRFFFALRFVLLWFNFYYILSCMSLNSEWSWRGTFTHHRDLEKAIELDISVSPWIKFDSFSMQEERDSKMDLIP